MRILLILAAALIFGTNNAEACPGNPNCTNKACTAPADEKDTEKAEAAGQEVVIKVAGMTCAGCESKVTTALESAKGVNSAAVCFKSGKATVDYNQETISPDQLVQAIQAAGFKANLPQ